MLCENATVLTTHTSSDIYYILCTLHHLDVEHFCEKVIKNYYLAKETILKSFKSVRLLRFFSENLL